MKSFYTCFVIKASFWGLLHVLDQSKGRQMIFSVKQKKNAVLETLWQQL